MTEKVPRAGTVEIHAVPGARKSSVAGRYARGFKIKIGAKPVDGAANEELIRFLARLLGVPRTGIKILYGENSRDKLIEVNGLSGDEIARILDENTANLK